MAEQALKSIPDKALKKIVRQGKLSALVASDEGRAYFDAYLRDTPNPSELLKYWQFHQTVCQLVGTHVVEEQLDLAEQCFKRHIALEADSEDRISSLVNRSAVNDLKKALSSCRQEGSSPTALFETLQKASFEHLEQEVFPRLIPIFDREAKERHMQCHLS